MAQWEIRMFCGTFECRNIPGTFPDHELNMGFEHELCENDWVLENVLRTNTSGESLIG